MVFAMPQGVRKGVTGGWQFESEDFLAVAGRGMHAAPLTSCMPEQAPSFWQANANCSLLPPPSLARIFLLQKERKKKRKCKGSGMHSARARQTCQMEVCRMADGGTRARLCRAADCTLLLWNKKKTEPFIFRANFLLSTSEKWREKNKETKDKDGATVVRKKRCSLRRTLRRVRNPNPKSYFICQKKSSI